jgi:hypothetical protein
MFVTIQCENILPSKKEMDKAVTMLIIKIQTSRRLQLGYESLHLLIADQQEVFRPPVCFVLPPHCTKDVYTPQGSTGDLYIVLILGLGTRWELSVSRPGRDLPQGMQPQNPYLMNEVNNLIVT